MKKRSALIIIIIVIIIGIVYGVRLNGNDNSTYDNSQVSDENTEVKNSCNEAVVEDNTQNDEESKEDSDERTSEENSDISNNSNEDKSANNSSNINFSWYKDKIEFKSEDNKHTFSMGWVSDYSLEFIFDSEFVLDECEEMNGEVQGDTILYKGINNCQVIYYYKENKIEVVDNSSNEINYSGVYCKN